MPADYTLDEQIEELERELKLRERVYPRWITKYPPKLTPAAAERQLGRLRAAIESLRRLKRNPML
jgi:hypothetical protein